MRLLRSRDNRRSLASFLGCERGSAVVFVGVSLVILVAAAGLAFDAGRGYLIKARLSQAIDSAALAGGRSLSIGGGGDYAGQITKYFEANFPDGFMGAIVSGPEISINADGNQISVTASAAVPTTLMKVLDVDGMTVSANATVRRTIKGLEVAMVLDNSGSMDDFGKINDLKDAAQILVDILYGPNETVDDLYVSVVPFTGRVNLAGQIEVYPSDPPVAGRVCLNERAEPHNTSETEPGPSGEATQLSHYSGTYDPTAGEWYLSQYEGRVCPEAAVLPLTQSKTAVEDAISGMAADGGTRYDVGMVWGWRALSPNYRGLWNGDDALPLDYVNNLMDKAVIVMTDGDNRPDYVGDPYSAAETEALFENICQNMKAKGVIIYTITFKLEDPNTNEKFKNCASGDARYFKSPNGEELEAAFTSIANDLTTLRLTR